jgi:histidyl-tRNA synthetase
MESLGLSVLVNKRLVRGLDYYTKTVFEVTSMDLGAQNAYIAGGNT